MTCSVLVADYVSGEIELRREHTGSGCAVEIWGDDRRKDQGEEYVLCGAKN
jgi:hypothetical protein